MADFNIGYIGSGLLAVCFLLMGAGVMYDSGVEFADAPAAFAAQIVRLYTENLGAWTGPLVTVAAFAVMFSTTMTVVDGFPRALATLVSRFEGPERPGTPDRTSRRVYWVSIVLLFVGSLTVIRFFLASLKMMVDVATIHRELMPMR